MDCAKQNLDNLQITDVDAVNKLKLKVICEYQNLIKMIQKGYKLDYSFIMEEISLIGLLEDFELDERPSLFVTQYYLNNKWEITQS